MLVVTDRGQCWLCVILLRASLVPRPHGNNATREPSVHCDLCVSPCLGGMFEYVSGANYFGECVEWTGYAIACWSWPGTVFAIFSILFLGSRAVHHHRWANIVSIPLAFMCGYCTQFWILLCLPNTIMLYKVLTFVIECSIPPYTLHTLLYWVNWILLCLPNTIILYKVLSHIIECSFPPPMHWTHSTAEEKQVCL